MTVLASGISFADLEFLGLGRIIATAMLCGSDGIAIVDPGPSTTVPVLKRHLASVGASVQDITALLLTHIHLDHAGATGTLLRENPRIRVHVHEVGAPHMVDPAKLLASAGRLYGDAMQRLWGEVAPVAASAIVPLRGASGSPQPVAPGTWRTRQGTRHITSASSRRIRALPSSVTRRASR